MVESHTVRVVKCFWCTLLILHWFTGMVDFLPLVLCGCLQTCCTYCLSQTVFWSLQWLLGKMVLTNVKTILAEVITIGFLMFFLPWAVWPFSLLSLAVGSVLYQLLYFLQILIFSLECSVQLSYLESLSKEAYLKKLNTWN